MNLLFTKQDSDAISSSRAHSPRPHFIVRSLQVLTLIFSISIHSGLSADPLTVSNARINATVPGMQVTGAYFDLNNSTQTPLQLVRVSGEVSPHIEIHEHSMSDGMMRMQEVENAIVIEADETLSFQPGGYHIMIMGLVSAVNEGEDVYLTLHFTNGDEQVITVTAFKPSY